MGVVYLVHFERPYKHAGHYWGWASKLEARMNHHEAGTGARLLAVVKEAGIPWEVALVMPGDKHKERQMKNRGGARRLCPICKESK
jgi:predicted GIY-YIG superfamily endonuclease